MALMPQALRMKGEAWYASHLLSTQHNHGALTCQKKLKIMKLKIVKHLP